MITVCNVQGGTGIMKMTATGDNLYNYILSLHWWAWVQSVGIRVLGSDPDVTLLAGTTWVPSRLLFLLCGVAFINYVMP